MKNETQDKLASGIPKRNELENKIKIPFSTGTMQKISDEYYTLFLYDKSGKQVYAATLPRLDAAEIMDQYKNIKMIGEDISVSSKMPTKVGQVCKIINPNSDENPNEVYIIREDPAPYPPERQLYVISFSDFLRLARKQDRFPNIIKVEKNQLEVIADSIEEYVASWNKNPAMAAGGTVGNNSKYREHFDDLFSKMWDHFSEEERKNFIKHFWKEQKIADENAVKSFKELPEHIKVKMTDWFARERKVSAKDKREIMKAVHNVENNKRFEAGGEITAAETADLPKGIRGTVTYREKYHGSINRFYIDDKRPQSDDIDRSTKYPYTIWQATIFPTGEKYDTYYSGFETLKEAEDYLLYLKASNELEDEDALPTIKKYYGETYKGIAESTADILIKKGKSIDTVHYDWEKVPFVYTGGGFNSREDKVYLVGTLKPQYFNEMYGNMTLDEPNEASATGQVPPPAATSAPVAVKSKGEDKPKGKLKLSDIPAVVKKFMPVRQQNAIAGSDEHWEIIANLEKIINEMPVSYGTDNIATKDKIVYLHYFLGESDWYIVEKDSEDEQIQAYGYVILNGDTQNAEWGYVNIQDDIVPGKSAVELDFFFDPIKFGDLMKEKYPDEEEDTSDNDEENSIYFGDKIIPALEHAAESQGVKFDELVNNLSYVVAFYKGINFVIQDNSEIKNPSKSYSIHTLKEGDDIGEIDGADIGSISELANKIVSMIVDYTDNQHLAETGIPETAAILDKEDNGSTIGKISPEKIYIIDGRYYTNYPDANKAMRDFIDNKMGSDIPYKIVFADGEVLDGSIDAEPQDFWRGKNDPFTWHLNTFYGGVANSVAEPGFMSQEYIDHAKNIVMNYDIGQDISTVEADLNIRRLNAYAEKPVNAPEPTATADSLQILIGTKDQYKINLKIKELIKKNGTDRDKYSPEELALLRLYEGSGGYAKQGEKGARLLDQFFTPDDIIAKMWGLAIKYGFDFKNANVLEPAVGTGRFLKYIPKDTHTNVLAFDVDEIAYTITKVLYPDFDIRLGSFESMFFKGNRNVGLAGISQFYDLVITNPPYRKYVSEYAVLGEKDATGADTFEQYFIARGIDLLKSGGLLIVIIPNTFLSNDNKYNDFKEKITQKADLVEAFRMPNDVFANTSVGTDILVMRRK